MGKSKNKKYKSKAPNPIGILSLKDLEMAESEIHVPLTIDAGTIETIIEKLQSRGAEERECAAVIIANMASNAEFIASIIENKVIRAAAPLLIDRNLAVRHAIAGCLRNIAVCGDYMVSEAMVEQDIMTSLVMLFEQYKAPWTPVQNTENTIDSKSEIFLEACNLLWSLCENSDLAVSIFNKKNIISILLPCLNVENYGISIPLAVAQCLHTVGENNAQVTEILREPMFEEQLKTLMTLPPTDAEHILLRALAAGMKLNIFSGKLDDCMSDVSTSILDVVSSTFSEQIRPALEMLAKQIMSHKTEKSNKFREEKDLEEKFNAVNRTQEQLVHLLSAKQICLEILGNMFEDIDGDEDEWDDVSSCDSSEVITNAADMDIDVNASANEIGLGLPSDIYKAIVNGDLFEKAIEQIVIPTDEILHILQSCAKAKECLKRLDTVRNTALLCLNNVIPKLDVDDIGGPSKLLDLWITLANMLFKRTDLTNIDQVEAVTRSMSAVIRKLAEANCSSHFSNMTESDLKLLVDVCQQSPDPTIKVHIIRVIGTLGCLLGNLQTPNSANLIKIIGSVLLDICTKNVDMWVIAEALDVTFDVFAEDHVDPIAKEISLVEKLTHILPSLKGKIKQQRKHLGAHLPVIITAKDNLLRFIKYKNDMYKT